MKSLFKFHKENTLIRPVVNCINSQNYKMSEHITHLQKEKIKLENKYTIKNSHELTKRIK